MTPLRSRLAARRAALAMVVVPLAGSSCGADEEPPGERGWRVASEPAVVIGAGIDPEVPFDNIAAVVRLSDGRIVVADGGLDSRLSVFSPEGRYLGRLGREGDGPGEFRFIRSLQVGPNDSLYVFDVSLQRLTVFSAELGRARMATFRVTGGVTGGDGLGTVRRLADGVWAGKGEESTVFGPTNQILRDTVVIGLLGGTLGDMLPLAYFPGRMSTTIVVEGRPMYGTPPFTPEVIHATWGRCVFASAGEDASISVYASDGELVATFEGPGTLRTITEELLAIRLQDDLRRASSENAKQFLRQALADVARPEHLPYYHRIRADVWGHLWLQEYAPPWGVGRRWYVLSPEGEHLTDVIMPKAMKVFAITEAGVLGSSVGAFEEEVVELLPWAERPSPTSPLPRCAASSGE